MASARLTSNGNWVDPRCMSSRVPCHLSPSGWRYLLRPKIPAVAIGSLSSCCPLARITGVAAVGVGLLRWEYREK